MAAAGLTIEEELARACQLGEEKKVQKFLRNAEIDIDKLVKSPKEDDPGFTLLMNAAAYSKPRLVKIILSHNASVNVQNNLGFTALHWASARHKNTSCAKSTLPHAFLLEIHCASDPRVQAANNGDLEIVKLLLDGGADHAIRDHDDGTALDYAKASSSGPSACVRTLQKLADAAKIAAVNANAGALPEALSLALMYNGEYKGISEGTLTKVRAWLDSGGHVDATVEVAEVAGTKTTMLMAVAVCGDLQLIDLLLAYHATVELTDIRGYTATLLAAGETQSLAVLSCFLPSLPPLAASLAPVWIRH